MTNTTHHVPPHANDMAQSLANDARTIETAQGRFTTRASLAQAIAAANRLAAGARAMRSELRRQDDLARRAEAHAAHAAAEAERRNAAIREQRGLPCPQ
jgi:hypothetical protein